MTTKTIFETDWLASTPVYYNTKSGAASRDIWQVMPSRDDFAFHPEGLYNYLDFGYSVFGQTPVENVRFLPPAARLVRTESGILQVEQDDDPVERWWDYRLSESDVIELIRERVQDWEASLPGDQEIVLPLSGGFDSRLLLWCIKDKSRVRAYTYGISQDQSRSTEVVHARALAAHFGIRWEQISLGDFHRFFTDWDRAFGPSTHAHGMYHFEFYTMVREQLQGNQAFLSGIVGDAWAGSIPLQRLNGSADLVKLGYTHGMRGEPSWLRVKTGHELRERFWTDNREVLGDHRFQTITTIRLKLMLISYLMRVPQLYDFEPWTPYLDIDIAMAMLNLPPKRRANRHWQRNFFAKVGLDLEHWGLRSMRSNNLNHQAMSKHPLCPLDVELLDALFDNEYLVWINRNSRVTPWSAARTRLLGVPKVGGGLRRLGVRDQNLQAYCAYLCLKPIENVLNKNANPVIA